MLFNLSLEEVHDLSQLIIEPSLSLGPQLDLTQRAFLLAVDKPK